MWSLNAGFVNKREFLFTTAAERGEKKTTPTGVSVVLKTHLG